MRVKLSCDAATQNDMHYAMALSPLPPLDCLQAFEASARLLSFTRAGQELHLSTSAVSRQISQLETFLGRRLFAREHNALRLTPAGETYAVDVRRMLELCTSATSSLMARVVKSSHRLLYRRSLDALVGAENRLFYRRKPGRRPSYHRAGPLRRRLTS